MLGLARSWTSWSDELGEGVNSSPTCHRSCHCYKLLIYIAFYEKVTRVTRYMMITHIGDTMCEDLKNMREYHVFLRFTDQKQPCHVTLVTGDFYA